MSDYRCKWLDSDCSSGRLAELTRTLMRVLILPIRMVRDLVPSSLRSAVMEIPCMSILVLPIVHAVDLMLRNLGSVLLVR